MLITNASVELKSITFSDGTRVSFESQKLLVLVGPNNVGKSACLREIENSISGSENSIVLQNVEFEKKGDIDDVIRFLEDSRYVSEQSGQRIISLGTNRFPYANASYMWGGKLGNLASLFVTRLSTDDRLKGSNPVDAIDLRKGVATHPLHTLQYDPTIEEELSKQFRYTFNNDVLLDRFRGSKLGLLVGERPSVEDGEDRISPSYRQKVDANCEPLEVQGDGMRAFCTIVGTVLSISSASIILIDEPEAFLHPPQIRQLANFLASSVPSEKKVVVATHSKEFLLGVGSSSSESTQIVRLRREGNINKAKQLEPEQARAMWQDAALKYSSIIDGVFFERVIITEAEADSMFYHIVLESVFNESTARSAHFVQGGGKSRLPLILSTYLSLDIKADAIVDIDCLNDLKYMRTLAESVGIDWDEVEAQIREIQIAVGSAHDIAKQSDVVKYVSEKLEDSTAQLSKDQRNEMTALLRRASPWGRVKQGGSRSLPSGQPTDRFSYVRKKFAERGVWIVPVGEMEQFCPSIGSKGQKWLTEVLENRDIADSRELRDARDFLTDIWNRTLDGEDL